MRSLERDWDITVGYAMTGGTAAFVAEATRADGTPAVVKIVIGGYFEGHGDLDNEIATFVLAGGRSLAELFDHDSERGALLLERLGPNLIELGLSISEQNRVICSTVSAMWLPAPDALLPSLAEKGPWFIDFIPRVWEQLDRPCDERVIDTAVAFVERRVAAHDPQTAVLLHGDAHGWNTLQSPGGGYKLIDPDGVIGEPAYDLAIPMREFSGELLKGDTVALALARCEHLSTLTGIDPAPIWEWGFVERVSTGLLNMQLSKAGGSDFLEVAERTCGVRVRSG